MIEGFFVPLFMLLYLGMSICVYQGSGGYRIDQASQTISS